MADWLAGRAGRARLVPVAITLVAAVAPFAPALNGGFVYDDFPAILKNPRVTGGPVAAVFTSGSYWREDEVGYRPLATLSFRANRAAFGERPAAYHATNLALHAANALLVAAVARAVLGGGAAALLAAALFAVHPAQVESVAGVAAGRAELLSGGFALAALVVSLRPVGGVGTAIGRVGAMRGVIAALLYLAALLSKESALPLPLLVFAARRAARGAPTERSEGSPLAARSWPSREPLLPYLLFAGALAVYLAMRHAALGRWGGFTPAFLDNPLAHAGAGTFLPGVLRVLSEYARLLVFPLRLSADYGYAAVPLSTSLATPAVLPGIALAAAVALLAARARRGRRDTRPAWFALAFAATLAIPLHLVAPLPALCAERFLYLPLAMAALFVGALVSSRGGDRARNAESGRAPGRAADLATHGESSRAATAAALAVVLLLAARSAARSLDWRDESSLFASSARAAPGSARSHNALGLALRNARRTAEAEAEFRRALAIHPEYGSALVNLGNLLLERGEVEAARGRYEAALAHDPRYERARWNLAVALERLGDVEGAAVQYAAIAAADATHFDARLRIAEILEAAGRPAEARRALDEALRLRPGDPRAQRLLERLRAAADAPTPTPANGDS